MENAKLKQHWRGKFVFRMSSYVIYRWAYTERQAWLLMCEEISRRQNVRTSVVMDYFDSKEKYTIEIETEIKLDE